ncbi:putative porin [uncultured Alistipes sp.]|uniref:putative porin n=1 Tax=uncultured Alistipes sp. TaxID=538949 RepID=UPI0032097A00
MARRSNRILQTLLLGMLTVAPLVLRAQNFDASSLQRAMQNGQSGTLYGSNPYEQTEDEEGQQQPQDTTKKERKIRKPLESYFFSDSIRALNNFMWHVKRDFNRVEIGPLDTMLTDYRIDYPFYREDVGDIAQGALGQTSLPLNYFRRPRFFDFSFASPYYAYTYNMENVPFYNTKRPMIRMNYTESGQKRYREENFGIMVAQNISPTTGFNVDYKSRGTRGQYLWSRTKNHNLSLAVSHTGRRYSIHAGYYNNHIEQQENGGVVGKWAIADTTFSMASGVPMRLADAEAQNTYRNNAFFVTQSYGIPLQRLTESDFSMAGLSAVYVGHSFEYSSWSKVYTDLNEPYTNERDHRDENGNFVSAEHNYYQNWFINPVETRDSIYERVISNRVFVQAQPWDRNGVVGTIDAGVGLDLHTYSQFELNDYLTGRYTKVNKTSWFAYGSVSGKIKKYVDWDGNLKFYPSGYRGGDLSIGAHLALTGYLRGHPLILEGRFSMERRSPNYWQENLFSNHYIWDTPLNKENETRLEVRFSVPDYAFEAGAWQGVVTDKIYYASDSNVAQHDGNVSLTSVYARKDFRLGGLHLDHRVLLQWSTDQEVIPVPLLSAFLSYYYEFWVVRDVLRLQIGLDGRYNTRYYAPGYNPALSVYYNQREEEVGNYPYMDAFVMAKWKRMRIFLKYQHVNKGLFGNGEYFSAARYPLNPGMFKIGISWGFYD